MHRTVPVLILLLAAACTQDFDLSTTNAEVPPSDVEPGTSSSGGTSSGGPATQNPVDAYPFVFAHGFMSSGNGEDGFSQAIIDSLAADGYRAFRTTVPSVATVAVRAQALGTQIDQILAQTGAAKVHVVGHSMGGLDTRYLISTLGYADRISSLTTISTPHKGSRLADAALGFTSVAAQPIMTGLLALVAPDTTQEQMEAALFDLSETQAPTFNAANPNSPSVFYQSYAGLSKSGGTAGSQDLTLCEGGPDAQLQLPTIRDTLPAALAFAGTVTGHGFEARPHDGVVTVDSSTWGRFRGCIPADHLDEASELVDPEHGFDLINFYRGVAAEMGAIR